MTKRKITDDLDVLMAVLPEEISKAVVAQNNSADLLEVILLVMSPLLYFTNILVKPEKWK